MGTKIHQLVHMKLAKKSNSSAMLGTEWLVTTKLCAEMMVNIARLIQCV